MILLLSMFCFVTFVQFDAFVLNKSINFFQKILTDPKFMNIGNVICYKQSL